MSSRLCPFCMRMTEGDTCPHCGKNVNYAGSPAHLPAGYVVSGKHPYVLGAALGQGGFGITYIALDMVTGERVAIKEYYPTYCSTRTNDSTVTAYSNQEEVYRKGKERFRDLGSNYYNQFNRERKANSMVKKLMLLGYTVTLEQAFA